MKSVDSVVPGGHHRTLADDERQLGEWAASEDLIELYIYYPGGSVRLCDRVQSIKGDKRSFLSVGSASFPADAVVYRESVGKGWIYNCRRNRQEMA